MWLGWICCVSGSWNSVSRIGLRDSDYCENEEGYVEIGRDP